MTNVLIPLCNNLIYTLNQHESMVGISKFPLDVRFWRRVEKGEKCWIWKGARSGGRNGLVYGVVGVWHPELKKTVNVYAHRLSYELTKGKIPEGKEPDHVCRNTLCVNPDHLEIVTHKENVRRGNSIMGIKSRQTHCKRGHPLVLENLRPDKLRLGQRACLTCSRQHMGSAS